MVLPIIRNIRGVIFSSMLYSDTVISHFNKVQVKKRQLNKERTHTQVLVIEGQSRKKIKRYKEIGIK